MRAGTFQGWAVIVLVTAAVVLGARPGYATPAGDYQDRLNSAVQQMLDTVVGPGRATVTTAVELDLEQVESVQTTYTQDPAVGALAENLSSRSYTSADGVTRSESSSSARTGALNSLREVRRTAPGGVKRLSVAVVVDSAAAADLPRLKKLVGAAAGIDTARGDVLAVSAMPFPAVVTPATQAAPETDPHLVLMGVALSALFLVALVVALRSRRRRSPPPPMPTIPLPPLRAELVSEPPALPPAAHGRENQRVIAQLAADDHGRATTVLRGWSGGR
ncbi:flagellar M-ring protein FliF C-terminal domain-containing protein [Actinoplanes sp. G11-F43]|uniref:flagellar M-ring protein FliF C-terminal domain-containing protein n=1 Tax=Actinoplanes sp. G11-F43 TaxID=3424130 RepID=UPI003D33E770